MYVFLFQQSGFVYFSLYSSAWTNKNITDGKFYYTYIYYYSFSCVVYYIYKYFIYIIRLFTHISFSFEYFLHLQPNTGRALETWPERNLHDPMTFLQWIV